MAFSASSAIGFAGCSLGLRYSSIASLSGNGTRSASVTVVFNLIVDGLPSTEAECGAVSVVGVQLTGFQL